MKKHNRHRALVELARSYVLFVVALVQLALLLDPDTLLVWYPFAVAALKLATLLLQR
jgi:hypothetical protein